MDFYTPPIDYAGMQPQHDLAKTFGSGFAIGDAIQNSILARKKEEAALERQKTMQERTHAVFTNPNATAKDIGGLALEFPEIAEHVGQAWKMMDEGKKEEHLKTYVPAYAAILNGKNDVAIKLMRDKAAAHRNSGDEEGAASDEDFADMIEQNPEQARNMGGMYLAAGLGADKFIDKFTGLNSEDRAQAQEGRNQAEEQRKAESAPVELETKIADMTAKQAVADNAGVVEEQKASQEQSKATKDAVEAAHAEEKTQAEIGKLNAEGEAAKTKGDPLGLNTPAAEGGNGGLTGQDLIATLPKGIQGQVKAYAEGRLAFPAGAAFRSPAVQQMLDLVSRYDPSFDAVSYNTRNATRKAFTSGKDAENITAINTAVGHVASLKDAYDKLDNSRFPTYNAVANWAGNKLGDKDVQANTAKVETKARAVAHELAKVFRQSGMSEGEINDWQKSISSNAAPAQSDATINAAIELMQSRLDAMGEKYNQGMGTAKKGIELLTPQNQKLLTKLSGNTELENKPATEKKPATAATTSKLESASRTPSMKAMAEKMGLTDDQLDAFLKKNGH